MLQIVGHYLQRGGKTEVKWGIDVSKINMLGVNGVHIDLLY